MRIYHHSFPGTDFFILSSRELAVLHTNCTLFFSHLIPVFLQDKGVGGNTGFPGNCYDSETLLFKEAEAI